MPERFASPRGDPHSDPFAYSKTKTGAALETDRPGQAIAERIAYAYCICQTRRVRSGQAKVFPRPVGLSLSLYRDLSLQRDLSLPFS